MSDAFKTCTNTVLLVLFFLAAHCVIHDPLLADEDRTSVKERMDITAYGNLEAICMAFATGYAQQRDGSRLLPVFGRHQGHCADKRGPLVVSVTHENIRNNHNDSANYEPNIVSYMADFLYDADFGRWLAVAVSGTTLSMSLDTVNFNTVNVTGWPLRYGHLFLGVNDLSVKETLENDIYVEFDIRVRAAEVRPELYNGYSGRRVLLGTFVTWAEEVPRTNRSHFAEIDFIQSDGYTESYGEPVRPFCKDIAYDHCFYDPDGKFAEGREVRFHTHFHEPALQPNNQSWSHIQIPLSETIRRLHWVSPPSDWSAATIEGVYLGIESEGATRTLIEFRNYHVYSLKRP